MPRYISEAKRLNNRLKEFNQNELSSLMKISERLTDKTFLDIHKWSMGKEDLLFPCVLSFNGEAWGLDISSTIF